ncbi:4Fe-4S binding protein [Verrucomicrobia bacterium S94]|nr:4Fe-4S binding protein [Verrucomicrobia bacterium S94]
MSGDLYTKRRRLIQTLSVLVLLSIPLRFFCFDLDGECIRLFGAEFGLATMFYPLFGIVALLLLVVGIGMKKGRIFCSHLCPMHMFLEKVNNPKNRTTAHRKRIVLLWSLLFSGILTEVILSFFQPLENQVKLAAAGNLPILGTGVALFGGFMFLFVGYQERFCKKGCPYALIQMLLQTDLTRMMKFENPEKSCTNCRKCEDICPMNLRARFESKGPDCTNCNLCAEACTSELGPGNTLFHFHDPEPENVTQ